MRKLKSSKGFSLVELIIVMAIMVALIAVLAPQFVKYVQRARNTVIYDAANQALSMVKTEFALQNLTFKDETNNEATIMVSGDKGSLQMKLNNLKYQNLEGDAANEAFMEACAVDTDRQTKSNVQYKIIITKDDNSISHTIACAIDVEMEKIEDGEVEKV